jgi:hypothetical protein
VDVEESFGRRHHNSGLEQAGRDIGGQAVVIDFKECAERQQYDKSQHEAGLRQPVHPSGDSDGGAAGDADDSILSQSGSS